MVTSICRAALQSPFSIKNIFFCFSVADFDDMGDMWIEAYESKTFREDLALLFEELRPLYEQLHAYVRRKLREVFFIY